MIRVAINGYGTIGKRVADAVSKQDDMKVVGVCKVEPDWSAKLGSKQFPLYTTGDPAVFKAAGIDVAGKEEDLLKLCDVVVDCTPKKIGAQNKPLYEKAGIKAIFQGGEKAPIAETSFVAQCNFEAAKGKRFVRVVSCNTTGLSRTLHTIHSKFGLDNIEAIMVRRGADQKETKKGPINAIVPEVTVPSHHGPDVQTVMPGLNVSTVAMEVPTTLMHLHVVIADLKKPATKEDIVAAFRANPRVLLVKASEGLISTAHIVEMARDLFRHRSDIFETTVWEDSVSVVGSKLRYIQAVHQESIVIPENVDAIRAMFGLSDAATSMKKTNASLGIPLLH